MSDKCINILLTILILAIYATSQSTCAQEQPKVRDLSLYELGGRYDFDLSGKNADTKRVKIRDFVWQHWQQRQRGYIVAENHSKEGDYGTITYYIEPDERCNWRVVVKIDNTILERSPVADITDSVRRHEIVEIIAYNVERIETQGESGPAIGLFREGMNRAPRSYRIRLKDAYGKVLSEF